MNPKPNNNDLLEYIRNNLIDDQNNDIDENSSLFQSRILDSLKLINLITYLEKEYNTSISPSEITVDNLDTVDKIRAFLDSKNNS